MTFKALVATKDGDKISTSVVELLKHISPLSWEHINLTGIYSWDTEQQMPEGFRSLRLPTKVLRAA